MLQFTKSLWNDEAGFVISAELALVSTLCVLGLVVGLSAVRDAVNCELTDLSSAICSLDQSYFYTGFHSRKSPNCCTTKAWTAGSAFIQGNKGCVDCVDFVTTSNVAPCQTCTTEQVVAPTVIAPEAIQEKAVQEEKIVVPQTEAIPCPPAALPEVPALQPTTLVCPPTAPVVNVGCPPTVSSTCSTEILPAPVACSTATCSAPQTCSTPTCSVPAVGNCSNPSVSRTVIRSTGRSACRSACETPCQSCQPACGVVVPAARPVLVPQRQLITW